MKRKDHRAVIAPKVMRRLKNYAFDASITAISIADIDGVLIETNDAFLRIWGYANKHEVIGKPIPHFLNDPTEVAAIMTTLNRKGYWEGEYTARRKDGSTFTANGLATVVRDENEQVIGYQSTVLDITRRKETEQALRQSESLLSITQRLSKIGGWVWDLEQQRMFWTEETYRIHDYAPGEIGPDLQEHISKSLGCCDEADRPAIMAAFQRCVEHGEPYDIEYPFTTATGRRLWVRTSAHAVWDKDRIVKVVGNIMDITEQKQASEALRESSELLALFLSHSPIYSFIKTVTPDESRVLYASENYQEMLGITGKEMVGKAMTELFPAEIAAKISADDWAVVSNSKVMKVEEELHGHIYSSIKFPIIQGTRKLLAGYSLDITEHKQAEQTLREWNQALERRVAIRTTELQQSEARFRQLSDAAFEGIAITENGILIDGNAQFGRLHGYELGEMIGRPVSDFIAPESRPLVAAHLRDGVPATYEFFGLRKDGSIFPLEVRGGTGMWQGINRRISALRDLSDIKQAATKLQAQQLELENAQRLALAGEISAGIVHQIGQPLCAMAANVRAALVGINASDLRNRGTLEILEDIEADIERMRNAVIQLRALAHPEHPTRAVTDFNDTIESVLRLLRQDAESRQIVLTVEFGDDLPPVLADAVQLSHAVLNLVHNAFDACADCPPPRRTVHLTTRAVTDHSVELSVRDAGTGIAPKVMASLFTPFFTTKPEGLGIGLRLCRTIVQAHGGSVDGQNNADGIGAIFRLSMPTTPE